MSFAVLAVISGVAVLGPLIALPERWHAPVLLGELVAGIVLGPTGLGVLDARDGTFRFLADVGFALVMFEAGSHIPVRDVRLRQGLWIGAVRAVLVGAAAVPLAFALSTVFHTGHTALYAVLMASSSAALILPMVDSLRLRDEPVLRLLPQVAIADTACIVALPLAIDPSRAGRAALGAAAVIASTGALYLALRQLERTGIRRRVHRISEKRKFALELRVNLVILFALAALAVRAHVSVMLAGFCFGLAVAAVGEPRRLAKQLFALTDGFLGPLFFVWLGVSLDLTDVGAHASMVALGLALGFGALAVHLVARLAGQPVPVAGIAAAQLGVPVAAATIGVRLLAPGEPAALMLGAVVTIVAAVGCGAWAARGRRDQPGRNHPRPGE
jgi:Kef-type K+ transport system membrane component KefB